MTYPQQNPGYPQGYPQQAPAQYSAPPAGGDPFSNPGGGSLAPKMRELDGRTVVFVPKRIDENSRYKEQSRPSVYADILVVDGGQLVFGGTAEIGRPETPPTHTVSVPALFRDAPVGNSNIVNSLRSSVGGGIVVGVIERSTVGNRPWNLVKTDQVPDGAARRELAKNVWFSLQDGSFVPPVPTPLAATPLASPVQQYPPAQQYGAPSYPPAGYAPQGPAQAPQQYPQQYSQGQPDAAPSGPPAGWDAAVWSTLNAEQRREVLERQPAQTAPVQGQHPGY